MHPRHLRHLCSSFGFLGVLAFLLVALPAYAVTLGPSKPSQLVTLLATTPDSPACPSFQVKFDRVLQSDGSITTFAGVPAKTVLIVTGFDWKATGTAANQAVAGEISVQNGSSATELIEVTSTSDASGRAGGQLQGQNIATIKSGPAICFGVNSTMTTQAARLYGYLTKDQ
jgi:hypothetical protein